jgi:hypothetical protein
MVYKKVHLSKMAKQQNKGKRAARRAPKNGVSRQQRKTYGVRGGRVGPAPKPRARQGRKAGKTRARRSRNLSGYNSARYGNSMGSKATDGINIMKTIHNGSRIEDTFQVRREKVANIIGSSATTLQIIQALYCNPGNSTLFPIFSQIAATYEEWEALLFYFSFETEAYAASGSNVSAGKVILATDYNPSNPNFPTDQAMENYVNSDRGAPYCEIIHDVLGGDHNLKKDPLKNYFVYNSANQAAPANDNSKFYDLGLFQLGVQGNASSTAEIGELYVTYQFKMIRPRMPQTQLGFQAVAAHISESANSTASAAAPLGTSGGVLRPGSTLPSVTTNTTFTLPNAGNFLIAACFSGSTAATSTFTLGSNITSLNYSEDDAENNNAAASGNDSLRIGTYAVSASGTGANNTITIGGLSSFTAGFTDIWIVQIPVAIASIIISEEDKVQAKQISTLEQKLADIMDYLREVDPNSRRLNRNKTLHPDFEDEVKVDPPPKMTESQLIDKTINKTIKRIKEEENKSTDTPSRPLNVSPGWFGTSVGSVALARDYNNSK